MTKALAGVGRRTRGFLTLVAEVAGMLWNLARSLSGLGGVNLRVLGKVTVNQIRFSGVQAMPLTAGLAALIGGVAIIQSFNFLTGLADDFIGTLLVGIIVREMAPLLTAVIFLGRSGTAMATEIGSMRLNGEVEALAAYQIDPMLFLVLPRVLAAVASMFVLIVLFDVMGILGGFAVSLSLADISFPILLARVFAALGNVDLGLSLLKSILFGGAIAILSCHYGLAVKVSTTELPQAVTRAVVASLVTVFVIDSALAALFLL